MIELAVLLFAGLAIFTFLMAVAVVKIVLWVVLLPFRLLFWAIGGLLVLPLLLLKAVVGGVLLLLALPLLVVGSLLAVVLVAVVVLLPLLPFVLLCLLIWYLLRSSRSESTNLIGV